MTGEPPRTTPYSTRMMSRWHGRPPCLSRAERRALAMEAGAAGEHRDNREEPRPAAACVARWRPRLRELAAATSRYAVARGRRSAAKDAIAITVAANPAAAAARSHRTGRARSRAPRCRSPRRPCNDAHDDEIVSERERAAVKRPPSAGGRAVRQRPGNGDIDDTATAPSTASVKLDAARRSRMMSAILVYQPSGLWRRACHSLSAPRDPLGAERRVVSAAAFVVSITRA